MTERQQQAARRDALGMSRAAVAESAGVSEATIARWRRLPEYRAIVNDGTANLQALATYLRGAAPIFREAQRRVVARTYDTS